MSVGGEQNLDELLKRLSATKRLAPPQQPFRTQQAAMGSQLRDVARGASVAKPRLADAIREIQQGSGVPQTGWKGALAGLVGSPVGKVVLGGLNVVDTPRRLAISTLKETVDALDSDPNTRASYKDFRKQVKDPSFGFGRVVPMSGWKGRLVGFIGDVLLDPVTYMTLGGSVPLKAAGASRLLQAGAGKTLLRRGVNVTGREGRFALAKVAKDLGADSATVARIAERGKSAVPAAIAETMGLPRNGLYMFGSRVKVPTSSIVGGALETGLVNSRLFLTNLKVGKKLQYLYTPKGASGGLGDVSQLRADLASGRIEPDRIDMVMKQLEGVENGRRAGAGGEQQYFRTAEQVRAREDVQSFDDSLYRFVENPDKSRLSPPQAAATAAFQRHFEQWHDALEAEFQTLDPSFKLGVGMRDEATGALLYVPHVASDDYLRYAQRNANDPWVQLVEAQGSVDVLDMKNNLASRFFKAGEEFLDTGEVLKSGSIDEINAMWRRHSKLDFDLFETSATKILSKYGRTVRSAYEVSAFLKTLRSGDFIREMQLKGVVDEDYAKAFNKMIRSHTNEVERLSNVARGKAEQLVNTVRREFDSRYRGSVAASVIGDIRGVAGEVRTGEAMVRDAAQAAARAEVAAKELSDVVSRQQAQAKMLLGFFEEKNLVMMYMDDAVNRGINEAFELGTQAEAVRRAIASGTADAAEVRAAMEALEEKGAVVADALKRAENVMDYYRLYGDELGPALQSIYDRLRSGPKSPEEASKLASDLANDVFASDTKVNNIMKMLMKPFDNIEYQKTTDLGEEWLRNSIDSLDSTGVLLGRIKDLGDPKGGRGTRKQMARAGTGGRRMSAATVNDVIGRASTVGDNHEAMADAFFFMTARELRAAYDAAGGGVEGLAAQNALAKSLLDKTTERGRLWNEANDAVTLVAERREALRIIGSRKNQQGGKFLQSTETIKALDTIDEKIEDAKRAGFASAVQVASALDIAKSSFDSLVEGSSESAMNLVFAAKTVLDEAERARPALADYREMLTLRAVMNESHDLIAEGNLPPKDGLKKLFDRVESFVKEEFGNDAEVRRLQAEKQKMQESASAAMKMDRNFTDVSTELLQSTQDAGIRLANYHILHATRLTVDALSALTPADETIGEALYSFALAGAARQQLEHVENFEKTLVIADEVERTIRTKVFSAPRGDRAMVLRQAVADLTEEEREAFFDVVGDLSFVEKQKAIGAKIESVRRSTPEYQRARDAVIDRYAGADWKNAMQIEREAQYIKTQRRAATYTDYESAGQIAGSDVPSYQRRVFDDEGNFLRFEYGEAGAASAGAEALRDTKNRVNSLLGAAPKRLNKMIDEMLSDGRITVAEAEELRYGVQQGEEAAVKAQSEARKRAGAVGKGERKAVQTARGVVESAEESFGMSRAFWLATRMNDDGSTNSHQRILDFFTMLKGDGEIRVANSGGFKRPQSELSGEEVRYAKDIRDFIFGNEKDFSSGKASKRIVGLRETRKGPTDLEYWQKLHDAGLVDIGVAKRKLLDIEEANELVASYKVDVRKTRSLYNNGRATLDEVVEVERRLANAQAKSKSRVSELDQLERDASQLITRGAASPEQTFKFVSVSDSVMGRARTRTIYRAAALRTLSRDPQSAAGFSMDAGLRKTEVLSGPWGYVEYLRGRVNELEAAAGVVEQARAKVSAAEKKIERAAKVSRDAARDAEAVSTNPVLAKRIENALNLVADDADVRAAALRATLGPKDKAWLGAKALGAEKGEVPERVAKLLNDVRRTKAQSLEIEKTPEYTKALERQFRNEVLLLLSRLNLEDATLNFPQNVFTESTLGQFQRWAKTGGGSQAGIDPNGALVYAMREVDQEKIADKILRLDTKDYVFLVGDRVINDAIVRDARMASQRSKFRYIAEITEQIGTKRKVLTYSDKTTGRKFSFGEEPAGVVEGQELVFDAPVYVGRNDALTEQFNLAMGNPMTTLQKKQRISLGKEGNQFYDPNSTWVSFSSPAGERAYRMDSIVGAQTSSQMNPLHPDNVFDAAQGRDIRTNFASLFSEPATPFSAEGRRLRAELASKRGEYEKLAVLQNKQLSEMRSAQTDKAYRSAQRRAATTGDKITAVTNEMAVLEKQIQDSNPVTQMMTVESVLRVVKYFKDNPGLFQRLGLGVVEQPSDSDALDAIRVYVSALEYQKLNPVKGSERPGAVSPALVKKRKKFLNDKFNKSEDGMLLAEHRDMGRRVAAIVKELDTIKNGGTAQELVASLRAERAELTRAEKALKLSENNLKQTLREKRVSVPAGETPAGVAGRVLAEREQAVSAAPVRTIGEAMGKKKPKARVERAQREAEGLGELSGWYEVAGSGLKSSLVAINQNVAQSRSVLNTLLDKERDLLQRIDDMSRVIEGGNLTPAQAGRLDSDFKDLKFQLNGSPRVPGLKKKIADTEKVIADLQKKKLGIEAELIQERSGADVSFYAQLNVDDARRRLDVLRGSLEDIKILRTKGKVRKNDGWQVEFDEFVVELNSLMQRLSSMPEGPSTDKIAGVLTGYLEAKANLLRKEADLSELQIAAKNGQMFSAGDHVMFERVLSEGWKQLTGSGALRGFQTIEMRPEVAEILTNMGRLTTPAFVKQMRAWFGPYTRFFKAWALATPGYHVRNAGTNAFMMVAAGGKPAYLSEGMREYNALYKALKDPSMNVETYLASLPVERRNIVSQAYQAMLGSGVGQSEEIAFDTANVLTNNAWTRANRKVGVWTEQHSRFMLAYDGIKQGLDVNGAQARVRKFLFDYEDISTLDEVMRTIIPFWMWTSRNLPLTVQNIYMNPRPYQWYESLRRNIEDREKTEGLPLYMREAGAFALPGTTFAATPDLGFNRMQADVRMLTEPTRFASNVNPALRVPFELMAGKSFFRNREFEQTPIEVSGPVGRLASLLGMPIGEGSMQGGKQYVNEALLYGLTNAVPILNTAERFIPSQEYYQQRGSTNPLLGITGAPVREVTPQMIASEQRRRLQAIQALLRSQPQPEGQ